VGTLKGKSREIPEPLRAGFKIMQRSESKLPWCITTQYQFQNGIRFGASAMFVRRYEGCSPELLLFWTLRAPLCHCIRSNLIFHYIHYF
jgi:hypothetical protein